jgi:pimeloyl-ACP methyl ester carboxylesterase
VSLRVQVEEGLVVWAAGSNTRPLDIWFHPAFGDTHASYRAAFDSPLLARARIFVYDPPGHGASPPRARGLTIAAAARVWARLIARLSGARPVVLVGHSMAGMIASDAARLLARRPALVVSLEGNLVPADAYLSGRAGRYRKPVDFHAALRRWLWREADGDDSSRRFAANLDAADAVTLWTLGRSVIARADPGAGFRRLACPKIYYWDAERARPETRRYLARHAIPQRRLDGAGHWPMIHSPGRFYKALVEDIQRHALPVH